MRLGTGKNVLLSLRVRVPGRKALYALVQGPALDLRLNESTMRRVSPVLVATTLVFSAATRAEPENDYKDIDLAKHGIPVVKPMKDAKTGFIVGGKNTTAVIRGLTHINDISIADLERVMRPGKSSNAGFLGAKEKLLDVLAADNDYVTEKLG